MGTSLGGQAGTFNGLSGLTDFMLACFGSDTRDRKYGYDIANGTTPEKITNGFYGLKVLPNLIKLDPSQYPILSSAYATVIQKVDFDKIVSELQDKLKRF